MSLEFLNLEHLKKKEAYFWFFPLGGVLSILGAALWVPFGFGVTMDYPALPHMNLMVGGFLLSFASGFLMTALPKFTGSFELKPYEKWGTFFLNLILPLGFFVADQKYWDLVLLLSTLNVAVFIARRFWAGTHIPAPFHLILFGLFSAALGALLAFASGLGLLDAQWGAGSMVYRSLFLHNFMMSVLLGLGARLYPAFSGWGPYLDFFDSFGKHSAVVHRWFFSGLGLVLLVSSVFPGLALVVRPFAVGLSLFAFWKIHRLPPSRTRMSLGMWIGAWFFLLGYAGAAVFQDLAIHFYHLSFAAGFGLITLMIGSRVTLGHGGKDLRYENQSKFYYWIIGGTVLVAITRFSAGIIPSTYMSHLAYAGLLWVLTMGIWLWFFFKKT
jgi:uncharacterized protein involved in response to NO